MTDQRTDFILPSKAWIVLRVSWLGYLAGMAATCVVFFSFHTLFQEAATDTFTMDDPIAYADRLDMVSAVSGLLVLASFVTSVIGYGFFYHRSMLTAKALEPEHATVSATGMWWWHAVPFALLWKPVEGVMQVWRAVRGGADLPDSVPWMVALWWTTWLVGNSATKFMERFHPGSPVSRVASEDLIDIANYHIWSVPIFLTLMVCCVALWWITDRIYRAQQIIVAGQADAERGEGEPQGLAPELPENA